MRNLIPARLYLFNFSRLFATVAIVAAIALIVYSTLFGNVW